MKKIIGWGCIVLGMAIVLIPLILIYGWPFIIFLLVLSIFVALISIGLILVSE